MLSGKMKTKIEKKTVSITAKLRFSAFSETRLDFLPLELRDIGVETFLADCLKNVIS
jgi:hypothetical protein